MPDNVPARASTIERRPVGRPHSYPRSLAERRKLCETVIDCGKQGYSECEIAEAIDVDRATMKCWANKNHASYVPEFSTALARALRASQAYYERAVREDGIGHEKGQIHPAVWKHVVSCRFRADYGEDRQVFAASQNEVGARVAINYIMAPNTTPPGVHLHSTGRTEPLTIDIESEET